MAAGTFANNSSRFFSIFANICLEFALIWKCSFFVVVQSTNWIVYSRARQVTIFWNFCIKFSNLIPFVFYNFIASTALRVFATKIEKNYLFHESILLHMPCINEFPWFSIHMQRCAKDTHWYMFPHPSRRLRWSTLDKLKIVDQSKIHILQNKMNTESRSFTWIAVSSRSHVDQ